MPREVNACLNKVAAQAAGSCTERNAEKARPSTGNCPHTRTSLLDRSRTIPIEVVASRSAVIVVLVRRTGLEFGLTTTLAVLPCFAGADVTSVVVSSGGHAAW